MHSLLRNTILSVVLFCTTANTAEDNLKQAKAYYYGTGDVSKNYSAAREHFLEAAKNDSPVAYRYLATIYLFGSGVSVDRKEAEKWFQKAIRLGDHRSEFLYNKYFKRDSNNITREKKYTFKEYYNSGQLRSIRIEEGGSSKITEYYETGSKSLVCHIVEGQYNGPYTLFYKSGNVMFSGHRDDGELVGITKIYYTSAKVQMIIEYDKKSKHPILAYTYTEDGREIKVIDEDKLGEVVTWAYEKVSDFEGNITDRSFNEPLITH